MFFLLLFLCYFSRPSLAPRILIAIVVGASCVLFHEMQVICSKSDGLITSEEDFIDLSLISSALDFDSVKAWRHKLD